MFEKHFEQPLISNSIAEQNILCLKNIVLKCSMCFMSTYNLEEKGFSFSRNLFNNIKLYFKVGLDDVCHNVIIHIVASRA